MTEKWNVTKIEIEDYDVSAELQQEGTNLRDEVYATTIYDPELGALVQKISRMLLDRRKNAIEDNCGNCIGNCCMARQHAHVSVTAPDAAKIAEYLKMPLVDILKKYLGREVMSSEGTQWLLKFKKKNKLAKGKKCCPFLEIDKKSGKGTCSIYDVRPQACRSYPAHNCEIWSPLRTLDLKKFIQPAKDS